MKLARRGAFASLINAVVSHSSTLEGTTVVPDENNSTEFR